MQRLLILTFLVLFSSCGKEDDVFVFEGSAESNFTTTAISADYSVQFTIVDEKVHYIVTLRNRKYSDSKGGLRKAEQDRTIRYADWSKCYDKHGNVLFYFEDYTQTEKLDGVWKGVLNKVTAETVRKASKVKMEIIFRPELNVLR